MLYAKIRERNARDLRRIGIVFRDEREIEGNALSGLEPRLRANVGEVVLPMREDVVSASVFRVEVDGPIVCRSGLKPPMKTLVWLSSVWLSGAIAAGALVPRLKPLIDSVVRRVP